MSGILLPLIWELEELVRHRVNKLGHELIIVETGWCIHGGSAYYIFVYINGKLKKKKRTLKKIYIYTLFKLSPEVSVCYIKIMENTLWLKMNQVKYHKIRRAWSHCPSLLTLTKSLSLNWAIYKMGILFVPILPHRTYKKGV